MSIRTKILVTSVTGIILTAAVILMVVLFQMQHLKAEVMAELDNAARSETAKIAKDVYLMVRTQQENCKVKLDADIKVAQDQLDRGGAVTFDDTQPVAWSAENQFTKAAQEQKLPRFLVGGHWIEPNKNPAVPTPIIDNVTQLTGSTCTLFQRMNEKGDMLRIATSVINAAGSRAVGTYIPAQNADGTPNPVMATVLAGKTYNGRAKVVDKWYIAAYQPIFDASKKVVGMLYVGVREENVDALRKGIMDVKVGKTGYVYILGGTGDQQGKYIISAGGKRDGENIWDAKDADGKPFIQSVINKGKTTRDGSVEFEEYPWINQGETNSRVKLAAVTYFADWDWVIGAGAYKDDFQDAINNVNQAITTLISWTVGVGVSIFVVMGILAIIMAQRITKPIKTIVDRIKDIAQGEGDLTKRVDILTKDEIGELGTWFNTFVQKVHDIISQVAHSTHEVAGAATQIAASSEELASGISNQTQQVTQISAAVEEMSQSVVEVARKSTEAAQNAARAGEQAREGGKVVGQTVTGMESIAGVVNEGAASVTELGKRSEQIGQIVNVINDIADQTNLLALNAAIEAARAGEHGRGFAVVADEVRKLADRTTKATEEIANSIRAIQSETGAAVNKMTSGTQRVQQGVDLAKTAGSRLDEIVSAAQGVADMIRSIAAAAEQQSSAGEEISRTVSNIQAVINESSQGASQAAQAAHNLSKQAEELQALVSQFKLAAAGAPSTGPVAKLAHSPSRKAA